MTSPFSPRCVWGLGVFHVPPSSPVCVCVCVPVWVASCIGTKVVIKAAACPPKAAACPAKGVVLEVFRRVQERQLYKLLMDLPYPYVQQVGIWLVLRIYHRLIMAGVTSEALAETVCSYFSRLSGQSGQSRALGDVVNAVRLRCAGVTGEVQDRRFISTVLDAYFRLERGSSGRWHFWKRYARRAGDVEPSAAVRGFRTRRAGSMGATGFAGVERDLCGRRRLLALPGSQLGTFPYNPASGAVCRRTRTLDAMRSLLSGGSKVEVLNRNWRPGRRPAV